MANILPTITTTIITNNSMITSAIRIEKGITNPVID
jgi:hypothetical protein